MAKILLVEDAADTRDLVAAVLEMAGHEVESAETGEQALGKLKTPRRQPDVILMDMSLPGRLSGLDVVRELRAAPIYDATPILALTAHALIGDQERSLEAGCDRHITKPIFDLEEFVRLVSHYAANGREIPETQA